MQYGGFSNTIRSVLFEVFRTTLVEEKFSIVLTRNSKHMACSEYTDLRTLSKRRFCSNLLYRINSRMIVIKISVLYFFFFLVIFLVCGARLDRLLKCHAASNSITVF